MANDSFEHAKQNANKDCPKCHGAGSYQYSTHGTPHFTICNLCCKHDRGFWKLVEHYGNDNGKWCCIAGCGFLKDTEHGG